MATNADIASKFHFSREMVEGEIYRKYEKAMRKFWTVEDLDFTQDALDWQRISPEQRKGLLGVTVRFLAGEQAVEQGVRQRVQQAGHDGHLPGNHPAAGAGLDGPPGAVGKGVGVQ